MAFRNATAFYFKATVAFGTIGTGGTVATIITGWMLWIEMRPAFAKHAPKDVKIHWDPTVIKAFFIFLAITAVAGWAAEQCARKMDWNWDRAMITRLASEIPGLTPRQRRRLAIIKARHNSGS